MAFVMVIWWRLTLELVYALAVKIINFENPRVVEVVSITVLLNLFSAKPNRPDN